MTVRRNSQSQRAKALALLQRQGLMQLKEFRAAAIAPQTIARLVEDKLIARPARGLYQLPGTKPKPDPRDKLAQAAERVPKGVVCLTSALAHHGLTVQTPSIVWMAISRTGWKPNVIKPRITFVRFPDRALKEDVRRHRIDGVDVTITEPARTIVDCFRYRDTVGIDTALEGLRRALEQRRCTPAEIDRIARSRRIWSVIEPYLKALVADGA